MASRCTYCTTLKGLILTIVFCVLTLVLGVYFRLNITPSKFRSKDEDSSILFNLVSSASAMVTNGSGLSNNPISLKSTLVPNGSNLSSNNHFSSKSALVTDGSNLSSNNPISLKSTLVTDASNLSSNNPISSKSTLVTNDSNLSNNPGSLKSTLITNASDLSNNPISSKSTLVTNGSNLSNNPGSLKSTLITNASDLSINTISSKSTLVTNGSNLSNNPRSSHSTAVTNGLSVPNNTISSNSILVANDSTTLLFEDGKHKCKSVLPSMLNGTWLKRNLTDSERTDIDLFLLKARNGHSLPSTLERPDRKCGNVTFDSLKHGFASVMWFRALCDPKGDKPCCYNGACVAASEEQCRCENCYDMRQPVHAEYSKWITSNSECQPREFNHTEVCHLLKGAILHFVGDSFVRHIYTGLLLIMRNDFQYGGLRMNAPPAIKAECKGVYMFTEKACRIWTDTNVSVCNGTVHATWHFQHRSTDGFNYINQAQSLSTTNRSMLILGIGIHENYNPATTINNVLNPLLTHMKMTRQVWPRILWASPHAPGLLKTPRIPQQNYQSVLNYNKIVNNYVKTWGIPVFDTFQLTDGMMSFDGAHYGFGVNNMKARILLNYIQELSDKMMW